MNRLVLWPSSYLPNLGGVEEMTRQLALQLVDGGDAVEVWTQQQDGTARPTAETMDGIVVRRFPFPLPSTDPRCVVPLAAAGIPSLAALRNAARAFRPDLLHVHCFGPNGVYATTLSALTGLPLVVSLHGETVMDDADVFEHSATLRSALRTAIKRARVVTGCSQFTLDDAAARFGLGAGRGRVVFNGVTAPSEGSPPARPVEGRYVLAVGRVVEKKGFDLLLRAFASMARTHPDVDLAVVGSGRQSGPLTELAGSLGIGERVHFTGRLPREAVEGAMAGAELLVVPSRLEPFGMVVLEAWRAGLAPVVTSRGGTVEFVEDGRTGLLVDPFDVPALASAISRLLDDDGLRARIAGAGRRRAADFSWPAVAQEYRHAYESALAGR